MIFHLKSKLPEALIFLFICASMDIITSFLIPNSTVAQLVLQPQK